MNKIFALVIALLTLTMFACSGTTTAKQADVNEVYSELIATGHFDTMVSVSERDMYEIYGIDLEKVKQAAFYVSENSSINADEIAIFEVADEAYLDTLYNILSTRINDQIRLCENYSQTEASKLNKTSVTKIGNYCYYIVNDNYTDLMDIMKDKIG